jgi:dTDP-4-dehydrorhamnose reductase
VGVLITGAHGYLGRHLIGVASVGGRWDAAAPTSSEVDVRDAAAVREAVSSLRPDAVVHLAYRKDDRATIVDGSANVAAASVAQGSRLVHLSTDVVFGDRVDPWTEEDLPAPVHAYGRAKADAEERVAAADPAAVLVRTSLLYGDRHLAAIQRDVADAVAGRTSMRFFTDEVRCPVHADDVAAAVLRLVGDLDDVRGPLHVAGPEAMSRAELARRFACHLSLDEQRVPTVSAAALGVDRERPMHVVLDSSRAAGLGLVARPVDVALDR